MASINCCSNTSDCAEGLFLIKENSILISFHCELKYLCTV